MTFYQKKIFSKLFLWAAPYILWLFSYRKFFTDGLVQFADAQKSFAYTNYYFNHLLRGVFPLWDPFNFWGRPDDFNVRMIGECNPFLYVAFLLKAIGVSFTSAYTFFLISYFFLGIIGFTLLVHRLYGGQCAYLAAILLLFSSFGHNIFNNTLVILITVPMFWFFYSLVAFTQTSRPCFFVALVFCAMIINITYLPFYFLTAFLAFGVFFLLIYFDSLKELFARYAIFIKTHARIFWICIFSFALSLTPGVLWFLAGKNGEHIAAWRGAGVDAEHASGIPLEVINMSSLIGHTTLKGLVSYLHLVDFTALFVPVFIFIILMAGIFVRVERKLILYTCIFMFLLLFSLAEVTPIHKFFYTHVFWVKMFRNLHYFMWVLYPVFILFVCGQFYWLANLKPTSLGRKILLSVYLIACHVICVMILIKEGTSTSSYLSVGLSLIFFMILILRRAPGQHSYGMSWLLLAAVVIQPLQTIYFISQRYAGDKYVYGADPLSASASKPQFQFQRPDFVQLGLDETTLQEFGATKDSAHFVSERYLGVKWPFVLRTKINESLFQDYTKNKIIIYADVDKVISDKQAIVQLEKNLAQKKNSAVVMDDSKSTVDFRMLKALNQPPEVIDQNSERFKVLDFDLNFIRFQTNFDSPQFIVYNDSFYQGWKAHIDGKREPLLRSNFAFKGVVVTQGKHVVELRYHSKAREMFSVLLILYFMGFLGWTIFSLRKDLWIKS